MSEGLKTRTSNRPRPLGLTASRPTAAEMNFRGRHPKFDGCACRRGSDRDNHPGD
jgi:hypothetical protein